MKFAPTEIKFSRDGKMLFVKESGLSKGLVFNLESSGLTATETEQSDFNRNYGLQTYPRVWVEPREYKLLFSPAARKTVVLQGSVNCAGDFASFN